MCFYYFFKELQLFSYCFKEIFWILFHVFIKKSKNVFYFKSNLSNSSKMQFHIL